MTRWRNSMYPKRSTRNCLASWRAPRATSSADPRLHEDQLARLGSEVAPSGRSSLRGKKVPPKYRDRAVDTWAGRGAKPRWLVAAIKEGKKLEDFAIEKTARKRR